MSTKHPVRITLVSRQDQEETVQQYRGERIDKGTAVYLRYEEVAEGLAAGLPVHKTTNTVKITADSIKLIRHGAVESEQSFQAGQRLPGFYRSAYVSTQLSQATSELHIALEDIAGEITWSYELYAYEECAGHFTITLTIQEEQQHESE